VLAAGKKILLPAARDEHGTAYRLATEVITNNMLGPDALEGVGAFAEKRKPQWKKP